MSLLGVHDFVEWENGIDPRDDAEVEALEFNEDACHTGHPRAYDPTEPPWSCTRTHGHNGDHVAGGACLIMARWRGKSSPPAHLPIPERCPSCGAQLAIHHSGPFCPNCDGWKAAAGGGRQRRRRRRGRHRK